MSFFSLKTAGCGNRTRITLLLCLVSFPVHAETVNLNIISQIESSGNASAIGDRGLALGLFQLHAGAVKDASRALNVAYKHRDALDPKTARVIADAYINQVIPSYLKHYRLKDTLENRLTAYNMGIGAVKAGKVSKKYVQKYKKLERENV